MQPVNDDMDNLFRRAADNYPLNTNGANFDKVRQQVDAEPSTPEQKEPKRKYFWVLLLLLVPLPFLLRHYKLNPIPQYSQSSKTNGETQQGKEINLPAATTTDTNSNTNGKDGLLTKENKENEPVSNTPSQLKKQYPETGEEKWQPGNNITVNRTDNSSIKKQPLTNKPSINQTNRQSAAATIKKNNRYSQGNASVFLSSGNQAKNSKYPLLPGKNDTEKGMEKLENAKRADKVQQGNTDTTHIDLSDGAIQVTISKKRADSLSLSKENKATNGTNKEATEKAVTNKSKQTAAFYIGIIAGPDISTVKSTEIGGPGYNFGFITGYTTGKHLAFETGIVWNNKRYHAEGKNVAVSYLGLDSRYDFVYLNGTCDMIEIPLSIHYHFNTKANNHWYVGTGISSYIMKKEEYNYKSRRYNMEYYRKKEYVNTSKNWLSVLQLQVGHEINFKNRGSLRFEPYAKLPLKGIGVGELPLSSAGMNIGFTMPIH